MKKVLTVLLTLVMAVCLINLNNSYTKAEDGNDTPIPCEGISFNNGLWKDGTTDITASLSNYGIEYNATTKVAKFSKSLTSSSGSYSTLTIESPLTIEISDNISIINTYTTTPNSTAIEISSNDVVIDGKNHTLKASSKGGYTLFAYLDGSSVDLTLKNITLDCDNLANEAASATIFIQHDLILQGNCLIEAINNGTQAIALKTGGAVKFNNDAITTTKEGNIAGKGQSLKPIGKNANNVYEFDNGGTPTIAKYIRIEQKVPAEPLTFTAKQAGSTVKFNWLTGSNVEYKTTIGGVTSNWQPYTANTLITLTNVGDKVSFKGTNVTTGMGGGGYADMRCFAMTGNIAASGDVTSLTNSAGGVTTLTVDYCYQWMFYDCAALTSIDGLTLPSTTLSQFCYYIMFGYCTGLTSIPSDLLPAGKNGTGSLAQGCYDSMFQGCTSLTSIPSDLLPAGKNGTDSLAKYCYSSMFASCSGLTTIPTDLLPATKIAESCYSYMFGRCTNLVNIPDLPATILASSCYSEMFDSCSKLKLSETKTGDYIIPFSIPKSGTTAYQPNCTYHMFNETGGTYTSNPIMSGNTCKQLYVAGDTTSSKTSSECAKDSSTNISITTGSDTQAEVKLTGFSGTPTSIKLNSTSDLVKGADYTIVPVSTTDINASDYAIRLSKLFISTLPVGSHEVKVTDANGTWTINIKIEAEPSPSPSPSKKDESCEKVIGPTWHWNNTKGICEDYGVVGTSTR